MEEEEEEEEEDVGEASGVKKSVPPIELYVVVVSAVSSDHITPPVELPVVDEDDIVLFLRCCFAL